MNNEIDEQKRKMFFKQITEKKKNIQKEINESKKAARKLHVNNSPDNIARIAFKKISTCIVPQFKKSGLDFYSRSTVSTAIRKQLLSDVDKGHIILKEYSTCLYTCKSNISQQDIKEISIKSAQNKFEQYEEITKKMEDYDLHDNVVDALLNFLCPDNGLTQLGLCIPNMVTSDIAPALNKLGFGDLVPELKQKLIEKYVKIGKDSCIAPEANIPYYEEQSFQMKDSFSSHHSFDDDGFGLDD